MKIKLEPIEEADESWLYQLNSDPKVMKFFPSALNKAENRALLNDILDHQKKYGFGVSKLMLNGEHPVGIVGLNTVEYKSFFTPCVELLWRILPDFWNKGLATEAAKVCMEYAKNSLKLKELYAFTSVHNRPSIRVMEKLEMKKLEGFNHPKISDDHWLSRHILYKKVFLDN